MTTCELMSAPAVPLGPAMTPAHLAELARTGGVALRLRIAAHARTSPETLALLLDDSDALVRAAALRRLTPVRLRAA